MAKPGLSFRVQGTAEVIEALRGVKFGVGNRILKQALGIQARKGAKLAKAGLAGVRRTGLLAKSIGTVWRPPRRGNIGGGVYVVGPRRSFRTVIEPPSFWKKLYAKARSVSGKKRKIPKVSKRLLKKFRGLVADPAKYAHLVERGRVAAGPKKKVVMSDGQNIYGRKGGKLAKAVKARPFMKPAADAIASTGPAEVAAYVKAGVAKEASKYAARGKSIYGVPGT